MASFNNGINFRLNNQYLLKNLNQQKAEEKAEQVIEQKIEAQQPQVEQPKVSSKDVLAFMEANAVQNAPKAQDTENVAPKQATSGARTETTEEVDEYGNKTVTIKAYDSEGNLETVSVEKYDKNGILMSYAEEYYSDGRITSRMIELYDENSKCISQHDYEYDKNGNIIRERISRIEEDGFLYQAEDHKYKYDEQGNLLQEDIRLYHNQGRLYSRVIKEYNNGNLISEEIIEYNEPFRDVVSKTKTYFDENGRVTKEERIKTDADGKVTKMTVEFEYTRDRGVNKTTTVVNEDGSKAVTKEKQDRSGKVTSKVTYIYDKKGNLQRTIVEVGEEENKPSDNIGLKTIDISTMKLQTKSLKANFFKQ